MESRNWDRGYGILVLESLLWNSGCGILVIECWLWNPGCGHLAAESWLWHPDFGGILGVEFQLNCCALVEPSLARTLTLQTAPT